MAGGDSLHAVRLLPSDGAHRKSAGLFLVVPFMMTLESPVHLVFAYTLFIGGFLFAGYRLGIQVIRHRRNMEPWNALIWLREAGLPLGLALLALHAILMTRQSLSPHDLLARLLLISAVFSILAGVAAVRIRRL